MGSRLRRGLGVAVTLFALLAVTNAGWVFAGSRGTTSDILINLVIMGTIATPSGKPLPDGVVRFGSRTATTDAAGRYSVTVPTPLAPSVSLQGLFWAPGYQELQFTSTLPVSVTSPIVDLGTTSLDSIFTSSAFGASMHAFPVVTQAGRMVVGVRGSARSRVNPVLYVQRPDGSVSESALRVNSRGSGWSFSGRLILNPRGEYQVEIAEASGIDAFLIPVFHGIAPYLPVGPAFPADPRSAGNVERDRFAIGLINRIRERSHRSKLFLNRRIQAAAQAHADDIARYGYYFVHPHIGSDGSDPAQRLSRNGVRCMSVGEAIEGVHANQVSGRSVAALLDGLFLSPSHRMILLGDYRSAGAGDALWDSGQGVWLMTIDLCR